MGAGGNMQIFNPSASFTRPATAPTFAAGQLIANSATAGSVVPMTFTLGNSYGIGQFRLTRVRISKTSTTTANANFRLHLYQGPAANLTFANGEAAAWSTNQAANWLGNIDVTSMFAFTDGAAGFGSASAGSEFLLRTGSNGTVLGVLMANAAYVGVSGETFTVTLEEVDDF